MVVLCSPSLILSMTSVYRTSHKVCILYFFVGKFSYVWCCFECFLHEYKHFLNWWWKFYYPKSFPFCLHKFTRNSFNGWEFWPTYVNNVHQSFPFPFMGRESLWWWGEGSHCCKIHYILWVLSLEFRQELWFWLEFQGSIKILEKSRKKFGKF